MTEGGGLGLYLWHPGPVEPGWGITAYGELAGRDGIADRVTGVKRNRGTRYADIRPTLRLGR